MVSAWWVVAAVVLGFAAGFFVFALMSVVADHSVESAVAKSTATDGSA